jgi:hypothetical protein
MSAFVAQVTHPEYWGIGVVAGIAPLVVPTPGGYVVGGLVGIAMVLGLALLEHIDRRDCGDESEARPRRRRAARFSKPLFAWKVRLAPAQAPAKAAF